MGKRRVQWARVSVLGLTILVVSCPGPSCPRPPSPGIPAQTASPPRARISTFETHGECVRDVSWALAIQDADGDGISTRRLQNPQLLDRLRQDLAAARTTDERRDAWRAIDRAGGSLLVGTLFLGLRGLVNQIQRLLETATGEVSVILTELDATVADLLGQVERVLGGSVDDLIRTLGAELRSVAETALNVWLEIEHGICLLVEQVTESAIRVIRSADTAAYRLLSQLQATAVPRVVVVEPQVIRRRPGEGVDVELQGAFLNGEYLFDLNRPQCEAAGLEYRPSLDRGQRCVGRPVARIDRTITPRASFSDERTVISVEAAQIPVSDDADDFLPISVSYPSCDGDTVSFVTHNHVLRIRPAQFQQIEGFIQPRGTLRDRTSMHFPLSCVTSACGRRPCAAAMETPVWLDPESGDRVPWVVEGPVPAPTVVATCGSLLNSYRVAGNGLKLFLFGEARGCRGPFGGCVVKRNRSGRLDISWSVPIVIDRPVPLSRFEFETPESRDSLYSYRYTGELPADVTVVDWDWQAVVRVSFGTFEQVVILEDGRAQHPLASANFSDGFLQVRVRQSSLRRGGDCEDDRRQLAVWEQEFRTACEAQSDHVACTNLAAFLNGYVDPCDSDGDDSYENGVGDKRWEGFRILQAACRYDSDLTCSDRPACRLLQTADISPQRYRCTQEQIDAGNCSEPSRGSCDDETCACLPDWRAGEDFGCTVVRASSAPVRFCCGEVDSTGSVTCS